MQKQKIIYRSTQELQEADYNPRILKDHQYDSLKESIEKFGLVDPILINVNPDRKDIIIGGHQRFRIAKDLNIQSVPCVELDLTLEQERELNIRLNKNTGEWDWDMLANRFESADLLDWGFQEYELHLIVDEEEPTDLTSGGRNKPASMKITFTSAEQLQKAQLEIQELLDRNFEGAYLSVSAGEI